MDSAFGRYFLNSEEAYTSKLKYEDVVGFIKLSADELNIEDFDEILVIELNEGVFIKTAGRIWCEYFDKTKDDSPVRIMNVQKFDEFARKYRAPIKSFGNEKLARWKLGF